MKTDEIKRKLLAKLESYCLNNGYDEDIIDTFHITSQDNRHEGYTDIYMYAEMSIEEFFECDQVFNDVVTKYDESAYFDVVEPGVFMTRIYWDTAKKSDSIEKSQIITPNNLIKFGEYISYKLEDEYDEEFWVEDIDYNDKTQKLEISVSSAESDLKTTVSIKMYEDDIDEYQDMVDLYSQKLYRALVKALDSNI